MNRNLLRLIAVACPIAMTGKLAAVAFRLPNQDPVAIARGNAFTATADNPSALYYNPAGITQLDGQHLSLGLYSISAGFEFRNGMGGTAEADRAFQFVPQIYYVNSPENSRFSYGVGVFAPYGLSVDYGRNTPFPTVAIEGELAFGTVNPTIAYQVNSKLSVGLGLALNYSDISFLQSAGPFGDFYFEGDDVSVGFNLGVLWQPVEEWSFGLNYRSGTTMNYRGRSSITALGSSPTATTLDYPMNIGLGVSYRPTSDWNIEVGIDWTDWDVLDVPVLAGTPVGNVPFPFNYESSFMYQLGVTRKLSKGYFLSAGYIYSENSAPDANFTPLNPDSDLHLWSVGVGRDTANYGWAFSYTLAYNGGRTVTGNSSPLVDGEYSTLNHALNVSYRFSF